MAGDYQTSQTNPTSTAKAAKPTTHHLLNKLFIPSTSYPPTLFSNHSSPQPPNYQPISPQLIIILFTFLSLKNKKKSKMIGCGYVHNFRSENLVEIGRAHV